MSWVSLSADGDSGKNDYRNVANEAFSSPTHLSRSLGNRAPNEGVQRTPSGGSVSSRRGPSQITSAEDAESFAQMFNSTAVQVPKNHAQSLGNKSDKPTDLGNGFKALGVKASRYYDSRASTDADVSGNGSTTTDNTFSLGSVERRTKDLDLANNDNSFHVIGGLIVEFFQTKQKASPDGKVNLTAQDIAQLDRLAPHRVRASFVEAVRYRFSNAPMDSTNSVHVLARQCHELGLDAVYPHNPLLVASAKDFEVHSTKTNNNNALDPLGSVGNNGSSNGADHAQKPVVETVEDDDETETYDMMTAASAALTSLGATKKTNNQRQPNYAQPRQVGEDPPTENDKSFVANSGASVRTGLTKMGVEMPYNEDGYSQGSSYSQQQNRSGYSMHSEAAHTQTSGQKSRAGHSVQSEVTNSLVSDQKSRASQASDERKHDASANLSMARTDDSSVLRGDYSGDYGDNENLAKQQLLAELQEAEGLMAESKTAEAAKFWRDHVQELEARLASLDRGEESVSSDPNKQASQQVSEDDNSEQRLMAKIMSGENNYVPPNLNPFQENQGTVSQEGGSQGQSSVPESAGRPPAPLGIEPSLEGVPMVDVVAPADLPGGYNFEAEIEGRRFLATVPAGGVQKGETFSCYMRDLDQVGSDIPVGRWRDGLFECLSFGLCHPVICNSLFCPLVLLGQIMSRVGFDFLGRPSLDNSINGPSTLWTIFSFWVFVNVALFCAYNVKWSRGMELSVADLGALAFVNIAYALFVVYLTSATRGSLREKYYIRESRFHDLEDCCCATFCLPFSLAQMARHTADYSEYEAVCCNESGLPDSYEYGSSGSKYANAGSSPIRQSNKYIV